MKFYVFDPMTMPAFSPEYDTLEKAVNFARKLQWRNKSFGVEVLAVAAEVSPAIKETDVVVSSQFAALPAPKDEPEVD